MTFEQAALTGVALGSALAIAAVPAGADLVLRPTRPSAIWGVGLFVLVLAAVPLAVGSSWSPATPAWAPDARWAEVARGAHRAIAMWLVLCAVLATAGGISLACARGLVAEDRGTPLGCAAVAALATPVAMVATWSDSPLGLVTTISGPGWMAWAGGLLRRDPRCAAARADAAGMLVAGVGLGAFASFVAPGLGHPGYAGVGWATFAALSAMALIGGRPPAGWLALATAVPMATAGGLRFVSPGNAIERHGLVVPRAVDLAGQPAPGHAVISDAPACLRVAHQTVDAVDARSTCRIPLGGSHQSWVWRVHSPDASASGLIGEVMWATAVAGHAPNRADWRTTGGLRAGSTAPSGALFLVTAEEDLRGAHDRLAAARSSPTGAWVKIEAEGRTVQDVVSICLSAFPNALGGTWRPWACEVVW